MGECKSKGKGAAGGGLIDPGSGRIGTRASPSTHGTEKKIDGTTHTTQTEKEKEKKNTFLEQKFV